MKKHLHFNMMFVICLLTGISQAHAQCATSTNVYAFTFNNKKYELVKEKKSWAEAAQCAVQRGGSLVQVDSLGEQTAIYNAIVASGVPTNYNPVSDAGNVSYIWIGATDKNTEGTWLWDGDNSGSGINFWNGQGSNGTNNGTAVAGRYHNWGGKSAGPVREPDDFNNNQDAAGIAMSVTPSGSTQAGEWNDIAITNTLYFVVEYEGSVGINESNDGNFLRVFPNPSNEHITLSATKDLTGAYLRLINITGELIFERTITGISLNLDISHLISGIYFVEINNNGTALRTKFVKH